MTPEQIAHLIGSVVGAMVAGALCGLIPFAIGRSRGRGTLGVAALITCTVCGLVLGILLAGPAAIVFSIVILAMGRSYEPPGT